MEEDEDDDDDDDDDDDICGIYELHVTMLQFLIYFLFLPTKPCLLKALHINCHC